MSMSEVDQRKVDEAVKTLGEFFENVRIFVSRVEENGSTSWISQGSGNLFAQAMQAAMWANLQTEGFIAESMSPPEGQV